MAALPVKYCQQHRHQLFALVWQLMPMKSRQRKVQAMTVFAKGPSASELRSSMVLPAAWRQSRPSSVSACLLLPRYLNHVHATRRGSFNRHISSWSPGTRFSFLWHGWFWEESIRRLKSWCDLQVNGSSDAAVLHCPPPAAQRCRVQWMNNEE